MPPLSRWYIKAAMVYLVAGLLMGALQALQQPLHLSPFFAATGPASVHLLVVGWITQMIFGVAYWMFPKYTAAGLAQALAGIGFAINTWPRVKVK